MEINLSVINMDQYIKGYNQEITMTSGNQFSSKSLIDLAALADLLNDLSDENERIVIHKAVLKFNCFKMQIAPNYLKFVNILDFVAPSGCTFTDAVGNEASIALHLAARSDKEFKFKILRTSQMKLESFRYDSDGTMPMLSLLQNFGTVDIKKSLVLALKELDELNLDVDSAPFRNIIATVFGSYTAGTGEGCNVRSFVLVDYEIIRRKNSANLKL